MKTQILAAIIAAMPTVVLFATDSKADPSPLPTQPLVKRATALTMRNGSSVPGEKKTYEAMLSTRSGPLVGKRVKFAIDQRGMRPPTDIVIGEGTTDRTGRARVDFTLPELGQGKYLLQASYAGDDDLAPANTDASLIVAKAQVTLTLDFLWGTHDNETGGKPYFVTLEPMAASSWTMKAEFDGDDATMPAFQEQTQKRPK